MFRHTQRRARRLHVVRQVPPGWTKIAPQTEKPLGSWASASGSRVAGSQGPKLWVGAASYVACWMGKWRTWLLAQMDHFVRRYKQYSDGGNMGPWPCSSCLKSLIHFLLIVPKGSNFGRYMNDNVSTLAPELHPRRTGQKKVILQSSGWVASISQKVCWVPWCRLGVLSKSDSWSCPVTKSHSSNNFTTNSPCLGIVTLNWPFISIISPYSQILRCNHGDSFTIYPISQRIID